MKSNSNSFPLDEESAFGELNTPIVPHPNKAVNNPNGDFVLALAFIHRSMREPPSSASPFFWAIPAARPFPLPYRDDFRSYQPGETPRYLTDQKGTFEVCDEPGHGRCLKQIVPQQGIMWEYMRTVAKPYTVLGDQQWKDYSLSANVRIAGGDVELGGRFGDQNRLSYRWILAKDGSWKLNYQEKVLASGTIPGFDVSAWHSMKLVLRGTTIRGMIDGRSLAEVEDSSRSNGMPYLGSTYDANLFDNLTIEP